MAPILILTGPPAAGKNTIADALAERLERCAVVDVDQVRWMVRQPHVAVWYDGEGTAQHHLGVQNACLLARSFFESGYTVIILDLLTDQTLPQYRAALAGRALRIVQLLPRLEEVQRRNEARGQWVKPERVTALWAQQVAFNGWDERIDTTDLAPDDVAQRLTLLLLRADRSAL